MIRVQALSKRFGPTLAVDQLSFEVLPGRVTGFLGPNGAGKSTTMRMILGLDRPSGGTATINGGAYESMPAPMREVGALLDAKAVHGKRSAVQHLHWQARAGGISRGRVDEVLEQVGLSDVRRRRLGGYSLGMAQRLGIAGALLGDPGTLLFDEPANGLDPEGIRWVRTLFRRLADEGRTILVSSHLMSEMESTADHVLVIGRGRLLADTSMAELTRRSAGGRVRVVSPDAGTLADLLKAAGGDVTPTAASTLSVAGLDAPAVGDLAAAHGVRVHELIAERSSLEAAFMELTEDSVDYRSAPAVLVEQEIR